MPLSNIFTNDSITNNDTTPAESKYPSPATEQYLTEPLLAEALVTENIEEDNQAHLKPDSMIKYEQSRAELELLISMIEKQRYRFRN